MEYLVLNNVYAYKKSFDLSSFVWDKISTWKYFEKKTVGEQFVRAVDSVSANIAEGFGRFHKKDKIKFYYNARGSAYEAIDWLEKSKKRNLLGEEDYKSIFSVLKELPLEINKLIVYTNMKLDK